VCAVLRLVFEDFGDTTNFQAQKVYTIPVQCKRAQVAINSYTEADTFEIEVDYKAFPLDPRTIRSCQVSIHMENMESLEKKLTPGEDNTVFLGFADEDEMTFSDTARTVRLKGRDYTGIFTDAKWPGKLLPVQKPLDAVVAELISRLKSAGDITVDNRTGQLVLPVLAKYYPDFGVLSGQRNGGHRETYWDVIQDIVSHAGLIAYIELDKLVITQPRTLYDPTKSVQFLYGENIKDLTITRKLAKQKGINIVVRCLKGKEILKAEIPKESTNLPNGGDYERVPKQSVKGALIDKTSDDSIAPVMAFNVKNVTDKAQLIAIGEKIYQELGRQQIEGKFKTYDMEAAANESTECFDLLKMRNGTPIQVIVGADDQKALLDIQGSLKEEVLSKRIAYLVRRGYDSQLALVFAQTLGKFSTPFYTKSVSFSMDADNGFTVDVDFINFIETKNFGLGVF
jgi:hypothetical protein